MPRRNAVSGVFDPGRNVTRPDGHLSRRAFGAVAGSVFAALLLLPSAGCGSRSVDEGSLTLIVKGAHNDDPLSDPNAATLSVEILDSDASTVLTSESFPIPGPIEIDHAPLGASRYFHLTTREAGGGLLAEGTAGPIDLVKGEHVVVTVVMQ